MTETSTRQPARDVERPERWPWWATAAAAATVAGITAARWDAATGPVRALGHLVAGWYR